MVLLGWVSSFSTSNVLFRSPVFRAMLESKMVEGYDGIIMIQDATAEVVKQLLQFMYCGKTEKEFKDYQALMIVADKYQVEDLKKHCSSEILKMIKPENAIEIGLFGVTYNCQELVQGSANYISKYPTRRLTEDWKKQIENSPKMMLAIIEAFKNK